MSQFKQKAIKTAALSALLGAIMVPVTANAAMVSTQGRNIIYKTTFNDVDGIDSAILDWKNQSVEFTFDMEDADWTDGLELLLSADPMGRVSSRTPILVQFNNSKPTPIVTRGQGFDTRIKLDKAKIRPRRNKIKFTYKTPSGAECLSPDHGAWRLNFKESFVVVKARAKSRNFYLSEVEARLRNATTAPKTISILARGQNTTKLQALAAQGIGMRVKSLPDFKTRKSNAEFEIVLGRRDQLQGWVSDKDILDSKGPAIIVHEGRPMRLVITGDTDNEVIATASAFASRSLPRSQRRTTSLGEMQIQSAFKTNPTLSHGTTQIDDLGGTYFEDGWGPKTKRIEFNVTDPVASQGEVLLRLASNKNVNTDSRVSVELNGRTLGYTKLNKTRKAVAFDIPAGSLQGSNNILTITPELSLAKQSGCNFLEQSPGFYLGAGSKLKIEAPTASPVAELSKLTATGAPFSLNQGKDTLVVLPARSSRDYAASLKVLAKLAKSSGRGWSNAEFMRSTNYTALSPQKNILFIGPSSTFKGRLRNSAPKGLTSALKGKVLTGTGRKIAKIERFAASDELTTLRLYAAQQNKTSRIGQGGVAALYPSPLSSGKILGVVTNVPGRGFSQTINHLVQPQNWNNLEGSVARWNKSKVLMAQTALPVPGFVSPEAKGLAFGDLTSKFSLPRFEMPSLEWSNFEVEALDMELAKAKLSNVRTQLLTLIGDEKTADSHPKAVKSNSDYVPPHKETLEVEVPSSAKNSDSLTLKLRGFSQVQSETQPIITSFGGIKSDILHWWDQQDFSGKIKNFRISGKDITRINNFKIGEHNIKLSNENTNMSALLLILIVGTIFALMGLVTPKDRETEQ